MRPRRSRFGHKYNAKRVRTRSGKSVDSTSEYRRYGELCWEEEYGHITKLKCQPKFPLVVNGVLICTFKPDFQYEIGGKPVVEEHKGYRTRDYVLKAKLFQALYPDIEFIETQAGRKTRGKKQDQAAVQGRRPERANRRARGGEGQELLPLALKA